MVVAAMAYLWGGSASEAKGHTTFMACEWRLNDDRSVGDEMTREKKRFDVCGFDRERYYHHRRRHSFVLAGRMQQAESCSCGF